MNKILKSQNAQWRTETIKKNVESPKSHMIRSNFFIIFICIPLLFASCSTAKIYTKPDARSYTAKYKTLAILPPKVDIEIKKNDIVENIQEQEMTESVNAQNEMYSCLLDFVQKGKIHIDIQPLEKTNAKFIEIGNPYSVSPEELAKVLGVDAILYTNGVYSKKSNVAEGIVYAILFFPYGTAYGIIMAFSTTYKADINMKLYDGATGYLLYNYNDKFSRLDLDHKKYIALIYTATKKIAKKSPIYRK